MQTKSPTHSSFEEEIGVSTAISLTKEEQQEIVSILEEKLDRSIKLTVNVDKSLIAGLYIRVGDRVFDETLRTRIEKLRERLLQ